ncbi:hypothetical protein OG792_17850 [Micromonospora sp. NBC_01699]|uniref:LysM peptidoglycan-binding domain-containing protein n=1 Tax=Micromonospora sp. NBC_01699 TaxID=2975984 RepID=UPI002E3738BE|nr:hypothetical protein [Micromonospora sp. NBC_01699]
MTGLVLLVPLGPAVQPAGPAAHATWAVTEPTSPTDRYYVVGPGVGAQKEYLYAIAVQTLGDGNRYREIFELNRDRPQPDGGRMTDTLELRPGWILLLPPDADGAGVRLGSPPAVPERTRDAVAEPARVPPPRAVADNSRGSFAGYLLRLGAFGLMVLLLAVALVALRRRRRTPLTAAAPAEAVAGPAEVVAGPAGVVAGPAEVGEVRAELGQGADRVEVRLTGAGRTGDVPAYGWLPAGEPLPGATMPVILGRQENRWLWADLARTPDVLTITGSPAASARQALGIVEQLRAAGFGVTVVGTVLGDDVPDGCRRVDTFPQTPGDAGGPAGTANGPGLVVSGGLRGADLRVARGMAAASGGRTVPMLVGKVLRARWSLLALDPVAAPPPDERD